MIKAKRIIQILLSIMIIFLLAATVYAEPAVTVPKVGFSVEPAQNPQDTVASIQILLMLTILSIAPSILIMMTSFTRIVIVLSFLRNALGTQQMPPNQVLIGLALFLTFFIMAPIGTQINNDAFQPYSKGEMTQQVAIDKSSGIIKNFMLKYTRPNDLALFVKLSKQNAPDKVDDLPLTTVIPAFLISELKTAFIMGFLIYIPFLVIDMVVSSTLMSMGMMMLPPVLISLPFKILLFIMVDGWNLITQSIISSFSR